MDDWIEQVRDRGVNVKCKADGAQVIDILCNNGFRIDDYYEMEEFLDFDWSNRTIYIGDSEIDHETAGTGLSDYSNPIQYEDFLIMSGASEPIVCDLCIADIF